MATAQVGAAVRIAVNGWSNPIELAGSMLRAGDDDSPEELTKFLRQGALAIKQLHDQVRQSQRDALLSADERVVKIIAQQDGHIFRLRTALTSLSYAVSACTLIKGESATMDVEKANLKARKALGLTESSETAVP